jgi:hypothetical protein
MKEPSGARVLGNSAAFASVGADALLSHLVMGFIERRVSPQTIADVMMEQCRDDSQAAATLNAATLNGVVEAITSATAVQGLLEILIKAGARLDFPHVLTPTATVGSLAALLAQPIALLERSNQDGDAVWHVLEGLGRRTADIVARDPQGQTRAARMRLINALKSAPAVINKLAGFCPSLLILRQLLLRSAPQDREGSDVGSFPSVGALFIALSNTPDHVLVHHMVSDYHVGTLHQSPLDKLGFLGDLCAALNDQVKPFSAYQSAFVVEWLFFGTLRLAMGHPTSMRQLTEAVSQLFAQTAVRTDVLKGVTRSFQRDLSLALSDAPIHGGPMGQLRLKLTDDGADVLFGALAGQQTALWNRLAVEFIPWALQLSCHPAESRLVTRERLEWLRVLEQRDWLEGLGAPPRWVVSDASKTAALIFQMAPGSWLQHHAAPFVDKLHQESLGHDFVLAKAHADFVEFLIRTVRKKAPIFASEVDTLIALQILGRAHESEQNQIRLAVARLRMMVSQASADQEGAQMSLSLLSNPQAVERLGPHPLARALCLFGRTAQRVFEKCKKNVEQRQFLVP